MTLLYTHPDFLAHDTGPGHPERPARLEAITHTLSTTGLAAACRQVAWQPADDDLLARVHPRGYIQKVDAMSAAGGGELDADTTVSPRSADVARLAAGAACDAVRRVVAGEELTALCLTRPPGHHALPELAMGFCLYANIALAARYALEVLGLARVMIVDFDVHHGNGTQDIFYAEPRVGFLSIHRFPFWPGSGAHDETGSGDGLGTTVNIPIRYGTARHVYRDRFRLGVEHLADALRPELVLVSAGFDAHRSDPIGDLGLETEDYRKITTWLKDIAAVHAHGRLVSLLEGGYNVTALADSVAVHLDTLLGKDSPTAKAAGE